MLKLRMMRAIISAESGVTSPFLYRMWSASSIWQSMRASAESSSYVRRVNDRITSVAISTLRTFPSMHALTSDAAPLSFITLERNCFI